MVALRNKYTWIALLAAAVAAVPICLPIGVFREPCNGFADCATYSGVLALVVFEFTLLASVFVGLPVYLVFRYFKLYAWWQYALGGLGIAAVVGRPFGLGSEDLLLASSFAGMGVVAASTFWLIAPWKHETARPPRS